MKAEQNDMMIGLDDTIDFFSDLEKSLEEQRLIQMDENFYKTMDVTKYSCAMNRLKYIRDREIGSTIHKVKKKYGVGYLYDCGHCGFDLTHDPGYKFCPNCGYLISWE